ncbi:pyridoxal phosphate-dependent aminotransferase [Actinomyces sp. 2119]|uniref:MalY/PatB family protein n=1 Tax=Actinomyces sp. 2119 TaxID=2321393 RepID=UPI000E6C9525|nr:MalY/PatB family protein [Actinomyces sp. 2119]RJF41210.1 pyridoxal phosphate-dependent aminotransferase [Actinomyces sp. 2119]
MPLTTPPTTATQPVTHPVTHTVTQPAAPTISPLGLRPGRGGPSQHAPGLGHYPPATTTPPADFDLVRDRRGTASLKWDFASQRGRPEDALPLWVADMDHATAPSVVSALLWRTRHGVFGYSEPDAAYHTALVGWMARRYGWKVDPSWNTVTPGVVPALALAVRACTAPGEAVVIEEPVYYPFREVVEANGRVVASAPLVQDTRGRYQRDLAALEATLRTSGARLLILCNPHNPVGRVWTRPELEALAALAHRYDVTVVSDEVHADLALPGHATTPFASLDEETSARTLTCTSPSKSFNLAGLQVANILVSSPLLRAAFRRELAATGYSQPNALGLVACRAAYESGEAWLDSLRDHVQSAREHVAQRLETVPGVSLCPAEGTYLLWLDCRDLLERTGLGANDLDPIMTYQAGLWLDDGRMFGTGGEGFTRLNVACPRVTLDDALDRLEAAVSALLAEANHGRRLSA